MQRTASIVPNYPAPPAPQRGERSDLYSSSISSSNNNISSSNSNSNSSSNPFKLKGSLFIEKEKEMENDADNMETGFSRGVDKFSFGSKKPNNEYRSTTSADIVIEENKLEQLQEIDDLQKDEKEGMDNSNLPPNYKQVILVKFVIDLFLMLMLSSTGASAIQLVNQINDTGVIFIGLYMILFSVIYMVFDAFVILYRVQRVAIFYKKNFGFFQGPLGRSVFLIFSGFFSFGIAQPRDLALSTGFLVIIWGIIYAAASFKWPQYFLRGNKIVPR